MPRQVSQAGCAEQEPSDVDYGGESEDESPRAEQFEMHEENSSGTKQMGGDEAHRGARSGRKEGEEVRASSEAPEGTTPAA